MTAVCSVEYTVHYVEGVVRILRDGVHVGTWSPGIAFGPALFGGAHQTLRIADACAREYARCAPSDAWRKVGK